MASTKEELKRDYLQALERGAGRDKFTFCVLNKEGYTSLEGQKVSFKDETLTAGKDIYPLSRVLGVSKSLDVETNDLVYNPVVCQSYHTWSLVHLSLLTPGKCYKPRNKLLRALVCS